MNIDSMDWIDVLETHMEELLGASQYRELEQSLEHFRSELNALVRTIPVQGVSYTTSLVTSATLPISPDAQGDLLVGNDSSTWGKLGVGGAGTILRSDGSTPYWGEDIVGITGSGTVNHLTKWDTDGATLIDSNIIESVTGGHYYTIAATLASTNRTLTLPDANVTITGGGTFAMGGYTLTVTGAGSVKGTNTGDVTLGADPGLSLTNQVLILGSPGSLSASSTNSKSGATHYHAIDSTIARSAITHTAGAGLTGGGDHTANTPFAIAAADTSMTINADSIQVRLASGGGLVVSSGVAVNPGAGITLAENAVCVDMGYAFIWTNDHTFEGNIIARHIYPQATDTYDLGTSLKLWRKGYLSELEALVFAENTIFPIGGWFVITKDQGTLPTELSDSATTYDFGKAMTENDFVVFRAAGVVEYIQVGSLVSGTEYNITRDLDGSGANAWVAGASWADFGYNGNGRIELNAYDTPRISLLTQGTVYNSQTEVLRLGDLNANWGYTSATYGLAIGDYGSGKVNMTIDPTNGYRLRTYTTTQFSVTPNLLKFGSNVSAAATTAIAVFGADQTYNSESVGNGDLLIGDNTATTDAASILWDKSTGKFLFRGSVDDVLTTQAYIDTTGEIVAGAGTITLNNDGIEIAITSGSFDVNSYKFTYSGDVVGGLYSFLSGGDLQTYLINIVDDIEEASTRLACWNKTTDGMAEIYLGVSTNEYNSYTSSIRLLDNSAAPSYGIWITSQGTIRIDSDVKIALDSPTEIDVNSTTALLVESESVSHSNVLVVDTTNGGVGINTSPESGMHLSIAGRLRFGVYGDIYGLSSNAGYIRISGGGSSGDGAGILMYGNSHTTLPGQMRLYAASSELMRLDGSIVFIGDNANANMTKGLTINQAGYDDEILAMKSSSDVAHGITNIAETDTYCLFQKYIAATGGVVMRGLGEAEVGTEITGYAPTAVTTKGASYSAKVMVGGYQTSSASVTNATADMNVFAVRTYKDSAYKAVMFVDEDGDIAVDGSSSLATFDTYDDVKLLTGLRASLMPERAKLREAFGEFMDYAREPLSRAGIVTYNDDGHHFISLKGLHMLEIDTIRQLYEKQNALKDKIDQLTMQLDGITRQLQALNS